jgi:hypothetical protein
MARGKAGRQDYRVFGRGQRRVTLLLIPKEKSKDRPKNKRKEKEEESQKEGADDDDDSMWVDGGSAELGGCLDRFRLDGRDRS